MLALPSTAAIPLTVETLPMALNNATIASLLADLAIVDDCVRWWSVHATNVGRRRMAEAAIEAIRKELENALDSEKRPRKAHKESQEPLGEESLGGDGELSPF